MRSIEQTFGPRLALAAPAPTPHLTLTRRGRLVLHGGATLLLVALGLLAALVFTGPAQAGDHAESVPVSYHVVMPGETLWNIAAAAAPSADRRDTVAEIVELNALSTTQLQAGQRIALPAT